MDHLVHLEHKVHLEERVPGALQAFLVLMGGRGLTETLVLQVSLEGVDPLGHLPSPLRRNWNL